MKEIKRSGLILALKLLKDCIDEDALFVLESSNNGNTWETEETIDRIKEIIDDLKNGADIF